MENVLKWVEDPANKKEAQDLGLLSKDALDVPAALANAAKGGSLGTSNASGFLSAGVHLDQCASCCNWSR